MKDSNLGGRLITAVKQKSGKTLAIQEYLNFDIFILKYSYERIWEKLGSTIDP